MPFCIKMDDTHFALCRAALLAQSAHALKNKKPAFLNG
jgi:hypothetical protein